MQNATAWEGAAKLRGVEPKKIAQNGQSFFIFLFGGLQQLVLTKAKDITAKAWVDVR